MAKMSLVGQALMPQTGEGKVGKRPILSCWVFGYAAGMNMLLLIVVLLLLFGGGGFYIGGPAIGGGGFGLILLIILIVYLMGGFRRK